MKSPVWPHEFDHHQLSKGLARQKANEYSFGICDRDRLGSRAAQPLENLGKRGIRPYRLAGGPHKCCNRRLAVMILQGR